MSEETVDIPKDLALRLSDWHSSMGDPIYAVSSNGLAGVPVPREVVMRALNGLEQICVARRNDPCVAGRDDPHYITAVEILSAMKCLLGLVKGGGFEHVALGMSRTLWASAWASEAEEQGRSDILSGMDILYAAPPTPKECLKVCSYALMDILRARPEISLMEIRNIWETDTTSAYDFGHELVKDLMEIEGCVDLEEEGFIRPSIPTHYYEFKDEWVEP